MVNNALVNRGDEESRHKGDMNANKQNLNKNVWSRLGDRVTNAWSMTGDQKIKKANEEERTEKSMKEAEEARYRGRTTFNARRWNPKLRYQRILNQYRKEEYKITGRLTLNPNMQEKEWLNKSCVGVLHDFEEIDEIQNLILAAGFFHIKAVRMGGRKFLLSSTDDSDLEEFINKESQWFERHLEIIQKWSPKSEARERLTWVICMGIPVVAWEEITFKAIAGQLGTYVKWDEDTMKGMRYDIKVFEDLTPYAPKETNDRSREACRSDFDEEDGSSVAGSEERWSVEFQKHVQVEEEDDDVEAWANLENSLSNLNLGFNDDNYELVNDRMRRSQENENDEVGGGQKKSKQIHEVALNNEMKSCKELVISDQQAANALAHGLAQEDNTEELDKGSWALEVLNSCRKAIEDVGLNNFEPNPFNLVHFGLNAEDGLDTHFQSKGNNSLMSQEELGALVPVTLSHISETPIQQLNLNQSASQGNYESNADGGRPEDIEKEDLTFSSPGSGAVRDEVNGAVSSSSAMEEQIKSVKRKAKKKRKKKSLLPSWFTKKKLKGTHRKKKKKRESLELKCPDATLAEEEPKLVTQCQRQLQCELICGDPVQDEKKIWEMGKDLGVLSIEDDEVVIRRLTEMELKDVGIVMQIEKPQKEVECTDRMSQGGFKLC
ncbi:hypothetical protein RIF29_08687 [Crotalaria pallida]|uniref:DUF4283 domain-containing protein n=1 Tax=Crotalaria pallida TaxID=3830 RepID=A0AAN9FTS8_CROPI